MELSSAEYLPGEQSKQALEFFAPLAVEYFPALQEVQTEAPCSIEYVPPEHGTHADRSDPCMEEYVPLLQSSHSNEPCVEENFPGLHSTHTVAPEAEKEPGKQE